MDLEHTPSRTARRVALVLALVSLSSVPLASADRCRVENLPPKASHDGERLLAELSSELAEDLFARGYVFPPEAVLPESHCPGLVYALVVFDADRDALMQLLGQTERQGEYLHHVGSVRSVMRTDDESIVQHDIRILFTGLSYQLHYYADREEYRIRWNLESGFENDLRDVQGYWDFMTLDGQRTLAVYGTLIDVGPILPQRMQEALTRKSFRQSIREISEWVRTQEPQR